MSYFTYFHCTTNCTYTSLNIESFPGFFTLIFSCFEPTLAPDKQVQIFSNSVSLLQSYPYLEDFAYGMTAESRRQ